MNAMLIGVIAIPLLCSLRSGLLPRFPSSAQGTYVCVVAALIVALLFGARLVWRCPACGTAFGMSSAKRFCRACGVSFSANQPSAASDKCRHDSAASPSLITASRRLMLGLAFISMAIVAALFPTKQTSIRALLQLLSIAPLLLGLLFLDSGKRMRACAGCRRYVVWATRPYYCDQCGHQLGKETSQRWSGNPVA
jgi:Zn finger protein HypA/HybF involved in hydrogenase expression